MEGDEVNFSNRDFERADTLAEGERQHGVRVILKTLQVEGSPFCIDCGEPIEPARRKALPSAKRCIECASLAEQQITRGAA